MFVLPGFRRQGVGMLLLDAAIRYARSLDGAASVHLSVSESAAAARHLYERAGFETWGVEPDAVRGEIRQRMPHAAFTRRGHLRRDSPVRCLMPSVTESVDQCVGNLHVAKRLI